VFVREDRWKRPMKQHQWPEERERRKNKLNVFRRKVDSLNNIWNETFSSSPIMFPNSFGSWLETLSRDLSLQDLF
jgi:hypothetical protein